MSIQVYMTDWWALHVCQEIQVNPSPLNSGFCILTLILFLEELGGCCRKEVVCFPSLEVDLFAVTVCSISLWAEFQTWYIWELPGKKRKWVRDPRALHTDRMRYRHSYILNFSLQLLEKERMKTMHEVTVASCIWCFSHSHQLCVAVGVMNCHLLCESPSLSWTVPLKCTPDQ